MGLVLFTLPLLGAVTLGESIAVLGTIASFLLNHPHQQQPTFKAMTSCWGDPWPITYNNFRVAAKVIQASQVTKHSGKKSKKGGPTYSQTLCLGFGEGPRAIGRIWADGTVIYDPRPIVAPPAWVANTSYAAGDVVLPTAGGSWQFTATITADSGVSEPAWNSVADGATADGSQVWIATPYKARTFIGRSYNYNLRLYNGDETQLPDSALEELVGVGNQSAYRGLVNIVLEDFDLSKYGNRIPNFEAELMPPTKLPYAFSSDPNWTYAAFRQAMSDPDGHFGYFWGAQSTATPHHEWAIVKVDLNNGTVSVTGPLINQSTNWPDVVQSPPTPSLTGGKVWYWTYDGALNKQYVISHDAGTLAIVDQLEFPVAYFPLSQIAINSDGTMAAMIQFPGTAQEVILMNLTSGANSLTDVSTVGGPADATAGNFWTPTFDASGHLWFYDDHGKFWRFDVAQSGGTAPTLLAGTSFVGRANDGSHFASITFNPDTGKMFAFSSSASGNDLWIVPFDTGTNTAGTATLFANIGNTAFNQGDMLGWHRGRYLALLKGPNSPSGVPNYAGLYDTMTATVTWYDWTFWGEANPGGAVALFCAMANFTGGAITAINEKSPIGTPAMDCWFFPTKSSQLTLEDICIDISDRVGLTGKYDYTALAVVIPRGAAVLNRQKAREFLEAIMPAYFYDLTDIGAQVIGTLRASSALVATIPENDLGAATDPSAQLDKISSTRSADLEIPRDMSVSYYDYNHDYQAGSQPDRRSVITQYSSGSNSLTIPVVMTPGEAADVAARVLYQTWIERTPRKASIPLDYIYITPADIIDLTRDGETYRLRVTKARFNPSQVIDIEGVSEDIGVYSLISGNPLADVATGAFTSQTIVPIVTPVLAILDTAPLRDTDLQEIGIYAAGCPAIFGGGFDGELVETSLDNSAYTQEGTITTKSTMGTAATVLADCLRPTVWDRVNTVDVTLLDGAVGNASESDMMDNLTNLCWSSTGEIFQFKTALPLGSNQYRLSTLLRGRYGTESFTGSHAMGEQIVMIDTGAGADIAYNASRIGQAVYWKAVNDAASVNESTPQLLTMTTRRLMPFAPYFLRGARDGSNNLTITGLRRMRWRGRPLWTPPETDTPLAIQIDIYNGVSIVRTLTSTLSGGGSGITDASAFTAYYSAADQTTDFGSTQASLSIIAYQLNAVVGRGYGGAGTV